MNKIKKILTDPVLYMIYALGRLIRGPIWADKLYLKVLYKNRVRRSLNFKKPESFNEKLQWLKIYDRRPEYTSMVDKYEAKEYIKQTIGEEYVIPTLGVWNSFDDIPFDDLPQRFVLKCTHDSGGYVIVKDKDKFDIEEARKKIHHCMKRNYFWNTREWPYKNITPRVIAEEYIEDVVATELRDYKLLCFNGKVKCSFVCTNRFDKSGLCVNFYDRDWIPLPFARKYPRNNIEIVKPYNYDKMIQFAETIAQGIDFLRVDFYECNGNLYFGEMTFYPGSGLEIFYPEEWDYRLGAWLELSQIEGD